MCIADKASVMVEAILFRTLTESVPLTSAII